MIINDPAVLAEVSAVFERYEGARSASTVITTYGRDDATVSSEFVKHESERAGRQTHTWLRTEDGWRVVAAHVSLFTPPPVSPTV